MRLCKDCERPTDQDDGGASFGNGHLCMTCGFYRREPRQKKTSRAVRRERILDVPTPTDPGIEIPPLPR
jgi:hypothetical protein